MSNEEVINVLKEMYTFAQVNGGKSDVEALDMAIKALQQQPCEDYIKILKEKYCAYRGTCEECKKIMPYHCTCEIPLHEIFDTITVLPLMRSARVKGKWIYSENGWNTICSICKMGRWFGVVPTKEEATEKYPICPQCGAEMRESEEKE